MSRRCLATLYGAGLSPVAPGTVGSLVAAVLAAPVLLIPNGPLWLIAGAVLFTLLGTKSADRYMQEHQCEHDPKEIVVDELAGQWLTYGLAAFILQIIDHESYRVFPQTLQDITFDLIYIFAGFLLFRLFDILKPWPISFADRTVKGGFGVMFDDLLAAIPAALGLAFLCWKILQLVAFSSV